VGERERERVTSHAGNIMCAEFKQITLSISTFKLKSDADHF